MTIKYKSEVNELTSQVKSVRSNVSEIKDEIAMLQNNLEDLRRMVSSDMRKIVDVVNNK